MKFVCRATIHSGGAHPSRVPAKVSRLRELPENESSSSRDATTHTFATANRFRLRTNPSCVRTCGGRDACAPQSKPCKNFCQRAHFPLSISNAASNQPSCRYRFADFTGRLRHYPEGCSQKHEQDLYYGGSGRRTRRQRQWRISPLRSTREDRHSRCCSAPQPQTPRIPIKNGDDPFLGRVYSP